MKLEKLFKKVEEFFNMDEQEQEKKVNKKQKLNFSLKEKIEAMKKKIKATDNKEKKKKIKDELDVLKQLLKKLEIEEENKDES
ncbi:MAG: hypothetical protein U9N02_01140 [Campylobacterota bacterium]|nr:hypothetical protein [Campylobacterota bacterium]